MVSLSGKEYEVVIHDDNGVTVAGRPYSASLAPAGTETFSLLLNGASRALLARSVGRGVWEVGLDGCTVIVEVMDERAAKVREQKTAVAGARASVAPLRAPMPGLVVQVGVEEGSVVGPGARMVIIEAMKMENELRATVAARVDKVRVAPGDAVEKDQVLVEFAEVAA